MIIESYEPFHIGIKIRPIFDLNLLNNFRKLLIKYEFEVLIDQIDYSPPPILDIARKNEIMIQINFDANAINVIGNDPVNVMEITYLIRNLFEEMNWDLKLTISFYEVITIVSVKTDKNPLDSLQSKVNVEIDEFKRFNSSVTGIKISTSEMVDETELFEFVLEPKFLSPTNRYYVRIFRRSKDFSEIEYLHNNINSLIENSIKKIENGA